MQKEIAILEKRVAVLESSLNEFKITIQNPLNTPQNTKRRQPTEQHTKHSKHTAKRTKHTEHKQTQLKAPYGPILPFKKK